MKCLIADFKVEFNYKFKFMEWYCKDYVSEFEKPEIFIEATTEEVDKESSAHIDEYYQHNMEATVIYRKIADYISKLNSIVLHSACFDVDGVGVAFAAHSGTGKTTHMRLWQEYLGDKMVVVNGDKPIVRFFDDEPETPYAYGTPWNGKERLGCNMRTPLKHICFIERSETNFVEPMDKSEAIDRIMNQVYMPKEPMAAVNTIKLIDRLLSCTKLWTIHCNMEPSAAEIAYKTIFAEEV